MQNDGKAKRILILGGTAQARSLAARHVAEGHDVITSLAGRTSEPALPAGSHRIGGFGGPEGLARYLKEERITLLIDATHPFAETISRNAKEAARMAGVPLETVVRPVWQAQDGDLWITVPDLRSAAALLPTGATAFLALGRQHVEIFRSRPDCRFILRVVDPPADPWAMPHWQWVVGKPSDDPEAEAALLEAYGVTHLVCRNSGGTIGYAKLLAARRLALPVVMISRPQVS